MKKTHGIRGSSKHILDWLSKDKAQFFKLLNKLLVPSGAIISEADALMPVGRGNAEDTKEARLDQDSLNTLSSGQQKELADWWLEHKKIGRANTPNWDLAVGCSISGRRGLVLVEAKAHPKELSYKGKALEPGCSSESKENDIKIGRAILEANIALKKKFPGIRISKDTHYQLSNRIAFSWKLASMGIPVVLVYLGFLKDDGLKDIDTPFASDEYWRLFMRSYIKNVVPADFMERPIDCGRATMHVMVRSLPIIEVSPSRKDVLKML
mgnify:CR=1 FL=1